MTCKIIPTGAAPNEQREGRGEGGGVMGGEYPNGRMGLGDSFKRGLKKSLI